MIFKQLQPSMEVQILELGCTEIAKAFNKTPKDYLRTQSANELINTFSARQKCLLTDLVVVNNGGNNYGTWMHGDGEEFWEEAQELIRFNVNYLILRAFDRSEKITQR